MTGERLLIVGAGGFGREVLGYAREALACQEGPALGGFLDDNPEAAQGLPADMPWLGPIQGHAFRPEDRILVAIGDPWIRAAVIRSLKARGVTFWRLVHPAARVAPTARLGEGCIVAPFSAVGNEARVGDHVVLTWYASIAHDAEVGDFAVLSPYATVNGAGVLGEGAFLGTHAAVSPMAQVGAWAKVAAGSVVHRRVPPGHLALGNPARSRAMMKVASDS